jgi:L-threonylcarbamoyladenylate synthase
VADAAGLDAWARDVPSEARALAARFWPGPLTLVLPRASHVPDAVTAGLDTVGLRVPSHPLALEVLARFGGGVAAPSANRYGRISPTTPQHVLSQFGPDTPLLLDGGACEVGIESTIVACMPDELRVLRTGSISLASLEEAAGSSIALETEATELLRAPGQDLTHYAPATPTSLVPRADLETWRAAHQGCLGFLGFAPPGFDVARDLRLSPEPTAAARELYAALHALDAAGLDAILVEEPPDDPAWLAVRDRLRRAAGRR